MRACTQLRTLAACLAIAGIASGCGASGSSAPKQVGLLITAPTNGATVGVRKIEIAGTVTPVDAAVTIAGHAVQVHGGGFAFPMALAGGSRTIIVTAQAHGYEPAKTTTTVTYSGQTASAIAAGRGSATRVVAKTVTPPSFALAPVSPKQPATTATPASTSNSSPSTVLALPPAAPPAAPTPPTTPAPGSPGTTSTPTVTPTPPAPQPVVWTPAEIHKTYVASCVRGNGGPSVTGFCQCTYKQIALRGGLRSRASLYGLVRALRPYERTHNLALLPRLVRRALVKCVQFLPDNNVAAKPVIKRLPSLAHRRIPAP